MAGVGWVGFARGRLPPLPHTHTLGPAAPAATAPPISKESCERANAKAQAQYKVDEAACASLSGNTKDICVVQAKGQQSVSNAYAEAAYENTPKNREAARLARAAVAAKPGKALEEAAAEQDRMARRAVCGDGPADFAALGGVEGGTAEQQAAEVLKHMGAKEVQKLGVAMTSVGGGA